MLKIPFGKDKDTGLVKTKIRVDFMMQVPYLMVGNAIAHATNVEMISKLYIQSYLVDRNIFDMCPKTIVQVAWKVYFMWLLNRF